MDSNVKGDQSDMKGETVMDNLKKMQNMLNAARSVFGLDLTLDELKATKKAWWVYGQ